MFESLAFRMIVIAMNNDGTPRSVEYQRDIRLGDSWYELLFDPDRETVRFYRLNEDGSRTKFKAQ